MDTPDYYFAEESTDKDGMYTVYFGNETGLFAAAFVAEFATEDDANEYTEWKNAMLDQQEGNVLKTEPDEYDYAEDELEAMDDDLVQEFAKGYKDD